MFDCVQIAVHADRSSPSGCILHRQAYIHTGRKAGIQAGRHTSRQSLITKLKQSSLEANDKRRRVLHALIARRLKAHTASYPAFRLMSSPMWHIWCQCQNRAGRNSISRVKNWIRRHQYHGANKWRRHLFSVALCLLLSSTLIFSPTKATR